jgi:hypothetical protein
VKVLADLDEAAEKNGALSECPKMFGERNFALMSTEVAGQNRHFDVFN